MSTFRLHIDCGNAAFDPDPVPELARILRDLAERFEDAGTVPASFWNVHDVNGNAVGAYRLRDEAGDQ